MPDNRICRMQFGKPLKQSKHFITRSVIYTTRPMRPMHYVRDATDWKFETAIFKKNTFTAWTKCFRPKRT